MLEYTCKGENPEPPVLPITDVPKTIEDPTVVNVEPDPTVEPDETEPETEPVNEGGGESKDNN